MTHISYNGIHIRHLSLRMIAAIAIVIIATSCAGRADGGNKAPKASDGDLTQVLIPKGTVNQTVRHKAMTIYFNNDYRIPNCVAYELTATIVAQCDAPGAEKRKNYKFEPDPDVADSPVHSDYSGTGYDRGHMAPANDFKWDPTAMAECFYMTNMCPQVHELNNGAWKKIENYVHNWASQLGRIIVVTGPVMDSHMAMTGRNGDIAVPTKFFKVVLAPEQQMAIAFVYDNAEPHSGIRRHVTTVREVEKMTGLDFFCQLADDVEEAVETKADFDKWNN